MGNSATREEVLKNLTFRQRTIVTYLFDNNTANRKDLLSHLYSHACFTITLKDGTSKQLSKSSADRVMRADILDIIYIGIPICSNSQDGYSIAVTPLEIDRAVAECESRRGELEKRITGLRRAGSLWINAPVKKQPKPSINVSVNQLNLFQAASCAAEVSKYLPEGRV